MAEKTDLYFEGAKAIFTKSLDKTNLAEPTKKQIIAIFENAKPYYELFKEFANEKAKDGLSKEKLAMFLAKKTKFVGSMTNTEAGECYAAMAGAMIDVYELKIAYVTAAEAGPVLPQISFGAAIATVVIGGLDAIELGNSCPATQQWWYDTFQNPRTKLETIRTQFKIEPANATPLMRLP